MCEELKEPLGPVQDSLFLRFLQYRRLYLPFYLDRWPFYILLLHIGPTEKVFILCLIVISAINS